jgi:hypothetical protein
MRPSVIVILLFTVAVTLFGLSWVDALYRRAAAAEALAHRLQTVTDYALTDPALFTEARYTRHPTQADLHSPFQDHPVALEHFPSGSLLMPPAHLQR